MHYLSLSNCGNRTATPALSTQEPGVTEVQAWAKALPRRPHWSARESATGVNGSTPEQPASQARLEKAPGPPDSSNPAPAPPPAAPLTPAQAPRPRPAGHCVGPAAPARRQGRGGPARVASPAAARKRRPSPTRRRAWRAAAACARPG